MEQNLGSWGIKDLWGDYELLFGASKLQLDIVEDPVHYQERIHGVTKMTKVFFNGLRMLRICWQGWCRLGGEPFCPPHFSGVCSRTGLPSRSIWRIPRRLNYGTR